RRRQPLGKRSRRFAPAQPLAPLHCCQPYSPRSANNAGHRRSPASDTPPLHLRHLLPPPLLLPELFLKPCNLLPAQRPGIRLLTPAASNRPLQHTGTSRCLPRRTTTPAGSRHGAEPAGSDSRGATTGSARLNHNRGASALSRGIRA